MWLENLHLTNFRNYDELKIDIPSSYSFFIGENGQGKTNILEAIALLSLTKSFRTTNIRDLIRFEAEYFRISGVVTTQDKEKNKLEVFTGDEAGRFRRAFFKNEQTVRTIAMFGSLPLVLFSPEQLNMLLLGPDQRRRYLNFVALQNAPQLWRHLLQYGEVLKQRNALLYRISEGFSKAEELEYWDAKLAEHGSAIVDIRRMILERINNSFGDTYRDFVEEDEDAHVVYLPGLRVEGNREHIQSDMIQQLRENLTRDTRMKTTSVGPHRDNWEVVVGGKNILSFGSRGQLRMALLAMKLAEKKLHTEESPVILLDDVFSELDEKRSKKILEFFQGSQVLITSTHLPTKDIQKDTTIFYVDHGGVKREP